MAQGTERRPECERTWYKIRVIIPHHSLLGIDAVFQIFSPFMLIQELHYSDCMPAQYVRGPELTNQGCACQPFNKD